MLLRFSVANFLCFKDEITLSLIASGDERHPNHVMDTGIPGRAAVLKAAGIYGANGHGKTKFVDALDFLESIVTHEIDGSPIPPLKQFAFSPETAASPSRFNIEFRVGATDYDYGLVIDHDEICEEWLFARYKKRAVKLFERTSKRSTDRNSGFEFGSTLTKAQSPNPKFSTKDYLEFLATTVGKRQPFLSFAGKSEIPPLQEPLSWFMASIYVIGADADYSGLPSRAISESEFLPFISDYVSKADIGIRSLEFERRQLKRELLSEISKQLGEEFLDHIDELKDDQEIILRAKDGLSSVIRKEGSGELVLYSAYARHAIDDAGAARVRMVDESAGTKRLIQLLPMMVGESGIPRVFVVDELDRKLHPLLAYQLLGDLLSCPEIQIVFTTHNTLLLDLDLLRRDEVWFVQKRADLSIELYSLNDFRVRPDLDVRRGYLNGRFGAIPFLGNLADIGWCETTEQDSDANQSSKKTA